MKSLKSFSLLVLFFGLALMVWSCGGNNATENHTDHDATHMESHHGEGKEYTSAYVCPMHCEGSGSEDPGKCPVCGMDYVAQQEHTKDGHTH